MTESKELTYTIISVHDYGEYYLLNLGPHTIEITSSDIIKLKSFFDTVYRRVLDFE